MSAADLFSSTDDERFQPLAARLRPQHLADYIGQTHLLAKGKALRTSIEQGSLHSMIFWGPPGIGKTSLAKLLAAESQADFIAISAVLAGVKDIRAAVSQAEQNLRMYNRKTILFVDEVHRFNKSQQDAFLPYVEDGTFTFVGATTENPSFEVNNALLSRCRVYILKAFNDSDFSALIQRALSSEKGLAKRQLKLSDEAMNLLVAAAGGDARRCLNLLEISADLVEDGATITE